MMNKRTHTVWVRDAGNREAGWRLGSGTYPAGHVGFNDACTYAAECRVQCLDAIVLCVDLVDWSNEYGFRAVSPGLGSGAAYTELEAIKNHERATARIQSTSHLTK